MVQEEGHEADYPAYHAIGSTILRRYAVGADARLRAGHEPHWASLTELLHDYGNWPPPATRGRAQAIYETPWHSLPEAARRAADDLVRGRGRLSVAPAIHWGAYCAALGIEQQLGCLPGSPIPPNEAVPGPTRNTLVSTPASRAYPEPRVVGSGSLGPVVALGLGAALGVGAMAAVARWS